MSDAPATDPASEARHISPWTTRQKICRVLWWWIQATAFRWSWHSWYGWRRLILRTFGATVHPTARIRQNRHSTYVWFAAPLPR